jgi:hypothetical protein
VLPVCRKLRNVGTCFFLKSRHPDVEHCTSPLETIDLRASTPLRTTATEGECHEY